MNRTDGNTAAERLQGVAHSVVSHFSCTNCQSFPEVLTHCRVVEACRSLCRFCEASGPWRTSVGLPGSDLRVTLLFAVLTRVTGRPFTLFLETLLNDRLSCCPIAVGYLPAVHNVTCIGGVYLAPMSNAHVP